MGCSPWSANDLEELERVAQSIHLVIDLGKGLIKIKGHAAEKAKH